MKKIIALLLVLTCLLSLAGCGGEKAKTADLAAVYDGISQIMPGISPLDEGTMLNFLGIDTANCLQAYAAISTDGMRTDEIWLLEAKDSATLETFRSLAENRLKAKADETISYAPDQYAVVEKAQVLVEGNYLALLVSPDVDALAELFTAAFQ